MHEPDANPDRKAISYAIRFVSLNGLFRLKPKSGFLTQSIFGLIIPTGGSSRKTRLIRLDPPVSPKTHSKSFTRVF